MGKEEGIRLPGKSDKYFAVYSLFCKIHFQMTLRDQTIAIYRNRHSVHKAQK